MIARLLVYVRKVVVSHDGGNPALRFAKRGTFSKARDLWALTYSVGLAAFALRELFKFLDADQVQDFLLDVVKRPTFWATMPSSIALMSFIISDLFLMSLVV